MSKSFRKLFYILSEYQEVFKSLKYECKAIEKIS